MGLNLDPQAQRARDLAKRAVRDGESLDIDLLLSALYHAGGLRDRLPELSSYLPEPPLHHEEPPTSVPLSLPLKTVLTDLARRRQDPLSPHEWFRELLTSDPGRAALRARGAGEATLRDAVEALRRADATVTNRSEESSWRDSPERRQALEELSSYGRVLTDGSVRDGTFVEQEDTLRSLIRVLIKRKQRNALVVGKPGTGKSALVQELARRLVGRHAMIPEKLIGCDIFELSPTFLRSGASMVGEYDRRVKHLLEVLRTHPRILLFVDEVHSLLQSGMHERGPFTDANESFKQALSKGEICLIGCTTTAEYRHYIAADEALAQRFSLVNVLPPSPEAARQILQARRPRLEDFYGLRIPPELVDQAVELTEREVPGRAQPRKSIQLLDEACAFALAGRPGETELRKKDLDEALAEMTGHKPISEEDLTEDQVFERLQEGLVGQDDVLKRLARAVVAGLSTTASPGKGPRGVFLLGGPSGVGKTETAVRLSRILGGGREALIRVNCNMLHGSSHDPGPTQNILLGVPPGFLGYVRGKGGELSRIRDRPQSVVLFDEIEKASSTISDLLLQIIDDGECEDADGNRLDFRRSFILFTTNAGTMTRRNPIGFGGKEQSETADASEAALRSSLRALGFHDAFLGRMDAFLVFRALSGEAVRTILQNALSGLARSLENSGRRLEVESEVVEDLARRWQPEFGARHLLALVDAFAREIRIAEAAGRLEGVTRIHLTSDKSDDAADEAMTLTHEKKDETLVLRAR